MRFIRSILLICLILCTGGLFAAPPEVRVRQPQDSVGLYAKFEILLDVTAEFYNPFEFIGEKEIEVTNGSATIQLPCLHTTESHASYTGPDMAYILQRMPETTKETKTSTRKNSKTR